jgi:hypothetical protein
MFSMLFLPHNLFITQSIYVNLKGKCFPDFMPFPEEMMFEKFT